MTNAEGRNEAKAETLLARDDNEVNGGRYAELAVMVNLSEVPEVP